MRRAFSQGVGGFINWSWQTQNDRAGIADESGQQFEFPYSPKHKLNFGAYFGSKRSTDRASGDWFGTLELSWRDDYYAPEVWYEILQTEHEPLPSYTLLTFKFGRRLPVYFTDGSQPLTVNLLAKNLLDDRPCETLVGVACELVGREFFVSIEYEFSFKKPH